MAKTSGMATSQNHEKRFKTFGNSGWSELNEDVLLLVMMQLGFVDYLGFSGVCKSWRSLAVSFKKTFIASRPPMMMWIKYRPDENELYIQLQDCEGREIKTLFPRSVGRRCVGLTCGYVIMYGDQTHDFWLVNPITRHKLYFPCVPLFIVNCLENRVRGVLIFSASISKWVFVMATRLSDKIWYSIPDTGTWNRVSSTFPIYDLHFFKGKIYTLHHNCRVCVMTLNPNPKLTSLEIENCLKSRYIRPKFISAGEKLYVLDLIQQDVYTVHQELDFGKMKWVLPEEKMLQEYSFFLRILWNCAPINGAAVKLELRAADPQSKYKLYNRFPYTAKKNQKGCTFFATIDMWYFLHECMNVNRID